MHIAFIISSLNAGGAERVLSELANHCAKGNRISLITLSTGESQAFYPLNPKIKVINLNQNRETFSYFERVKYILRRLLCIRRTIQHLNPDIIVSFIDLMNITTLIATLCLKIPVIISERIDPHFHEIPKFYKWLRLKVYPFASQLVVQTENIGNYFPKKIHNLIKIIPNSVGFPHFQKTTCSKRITNIVTVGRLTPQKDHFTLIQAFSNLLKYDPDLILTIYGEGQKRDRLEKLITSLNLEGKIFLPGTIKNVQAALVKADLFIFPSHYEGFPNALCEAMAVGLPVIASNCSGNIDIIRDHIDGRLFPIGDIEALTNISLELLKDPDQRIKIAQNAKKICKRFHPDRIFDLWDQIIAKVSKK